MKNNNKFLEININNFGLIKLNKIVLDLNGTIAKYNSLISGIKESINTLKSKMDWKIYLLSADTYGTASKIASELDIYLHKLTRSSNFVSEGDEKAAFIESLGKENVIAFGNGRNDSKMLKKARIGIAILGAEGLAKETLLSADIIMYSPVDALNLLLHPNSLKATLRN